MKRTIAVLLLAAMLPLTTINLTSCANMSGTVQTAQDWLNDPKNQALIQQIAQTAITLVTVFAAERNAGVAVAGKLAQTYPNVPAGAVATIAKNPHAYIKH